MMNTLQTLMEAGGDQILSAYLSNGCPDAASDVALSIVSIGEDRLLDILGGEITEDVRPAHGDVPFDHRLIVIEKKMSTPPKYPRKPGTPSKEPLK